MSVIVSVMGHTREDTEMNSSEKTRQLVPVFVEKTEGQDIRDLLYVQDGKGGYMSLAQLETLYPSEESEEVPGVLTTKIIETSSAERGTTITSYSVSPFRICCVYSGGFKYCFPC